MQAVAESHEEAFKKLRAYCDRKLVVKEAGNFKPNIKGDAGSRSGYFDERGFRGEVSATSNPQCHISVVLDLPLLMLPFKKSVTDSIQNHLAQIA
jgi:hypothetical protein